MNKTDPYRCPWFLKVEHERIERSMSRSALATAIDRPVQSVNVWLRGEKSPHDLIEVLGLIATVFGWTEDWHMGWLMDEGQPWYPKALLRSRDALTAEQSQILQAAKDPRIAKFLASQLDFLQAELSR